jgi:hypothetical protein
MNVKLKYPLAQSASRCHFTPYAAVLEKETGPNRWTGPQSGTVPSRDQDSCPAGRRPLEHGVQGKATGSNRLQKPEEKHGWGPEAILFRAERGVGR